jgi:hypothetical protein
MQIFEKVQSRIYEADQDEFEDSFDLAQAFSHVRAEMWYWKAVARDLKRENNQLKWMVKKNPSFLKKMLDYIKKYS